MSLQFVYPSAPALVLINRSSVAARDIKWTVALWNYDLPERNDPLPIPAQTFDWIRPHQEGGPQNLFGGPLVAPLLKDGDHLFGLASVVCPDSARGHSYVVSIIWGRGGWYAEVDKEGEGNIFVPTKFSKDGRAAYLKQIETAIPERARIPILER